MIDARLTLTNLHNKFPNLTLDDLFEILNCYTEVVTYDWSKWPLTNDKQITWPRTNIHYGNPTCTATTNFESPQKCD